MILNSRCTLTRKLTIFLTKCNSPKKRPSIEVIVKSRKKAVYVTQLLKTLDFEIVPKIKKRV